MTDRFQLGNYLAVTVIAAGCVLGTAASAAVKVEFDANAELGKIKPMHCVGQGPIQGLNNFEMFHFLKEAHVPYVRFHDVGGAFGKMLYVDIPNLFRDFDADETKPESYDFTFTDQLVKALVDNGAMPFFRLGVTIENRSDVRKYRIHPPNDFAKWARICERVIAHYNDGWANGFKYGIEYWEVWNEPDDRGDPESSFMWCGTFAEYCRLYDVTSKLLKKKHPAIKVGGFASCGFYSAKKGEPIYVPKNWKPNPKGHDCGYFIKCTLEFLDYVRDNQCPLDFFSFHSYDRVDRVLEQIESISLEMKRRGISPELILNEWLPRPSLDRVFSPEQNADIASVIVGGQHTDAAMLMLYDARIQARNPYAPVFNPMTAKPAGAYYALQYFGELYRRGTEVKCTLAGDAPGLRGLAATDGRKDVTIMLVNNGSRRLPLDFGAAAAKFRYGSVTEKDREGAILVELPDDIQPNAFMLLVFDR